MKIHPYLYFYVVIISGYCFASQSSEPSARGNASNFSRAQHKLLKETKEAGLNIINFHRNISSIVAVAKARNCLYQSEKENLAKQLSLLESEVARYALILQFAQVQGVITHENYEEAKQSPLLGASQIKDMQQNVENLPAHPDPWCTIQ